MAIIAQLNVSDKSKARAALWRAPAVMVLFTLLGLAFAIAHDRFYQGLNGERVHSYAQQQTVINAGTALAAIAKMFWVLSITFVFAQQMFSSLRQYPDTVDNIDRLFGMIENALTMGNLRLWFRHPILLLLAAVLWFIPLSAVFTPGTLNVQIVKYDEYNVALRPVQPQQSWPESQNFASCQFDPSFATANISADGTQHTYRSLLCSGPTADFNSAAISAATQRNIARIDPPMDARANVNPPTVQQNASYELSFTGPSLSCTALSPADVSGMEDSYSQALVDEIVPGVNPFLPQTPDVLQLKFNGWSNNSCFNQTYPDWHNGSTGVGVCGTSGDSATSFFFLSSNISGVVTSTFHSCSLYEADYQVGFRFTNGLQDVYVRNVTLRDRLFKDTTVDTTTPDFKNTVYVSALDAFDGIMLGIGLNNTMAGSGNIMFSQGMAQTTALRDFMYAKRPLVADDVATTLEEMFQNITVSAMGEPKLALPEAERAVVAGDVWHTVNVYAYQPNAVYISYGVALLITVLCNLWGFYVIIHKHGYHAYDLGFSTLLRTTRAARFDAVVQADACRGDGVVPKELDGLRLRFNDGRLPTDGEQLGFVPAPGAADGAGAAETGGATSGTESAEAVSLMPPKVVESTEIKM